MSGVAPITQEQLRRLHPHAVDDASAVRALLERAAAQGAELRRGMNRAIQPEAARIERIDDDRVVLRTQNFEAVGNRPVVLNFLGDGRPYSFVTTALREAPGHLELRLPAAIHLAERRDRERRPPPAGGAGGWRVLLLGGGGEGLAAEVEDHSAGGLGVRAPTRPALREGSQLRVRFLDGEAKGREAHAQVRSRVDLASRPGWVRLGLALAEGPASSAIVPEVQEHLLPGGALRQAWRGWRLLGAGARVAAASTARRIAGRRPRAPEVRVVEYASREGEKLVAILDSYGDPRGATAVVIAPAWGRTKETLLPLARSIVSTFRAAGQAVAVVRFDGIRKRGESHNDPECRVPGREQHHFSFSQGVRDIFATLDYVDRELAPSRRVLVTFSAASIDGRAALARDGGARLGGWICVVGSSDLQSMMRVISGGVDYLGGAERGVRFGIQEILGVEVDMDFAALDAIRAGMAFLEDSRRDFGEIAVPVTWLHGKHDAWMDLGRIRDVLSHGPQEQRRLVVVPTGHQLSSSRQALEVFQWIASEAARMALGRALPPRAPDLGDLEARRRAERGRLPRPGADLRAFWRDYLVGRDGRLGIELMTSASAYQKLMAAQIEALELREGARVADLGAGTGAFALQLGARADRPRSLEVVALDFVGAALRRARSRLRACDTPGLAVHFVECNLALAGGRRGVPLRSAGFDAVLASLLLSYLDAPEMLLREAARLLRPGGRLVISTLCKDADISKIYVEGFEELKAGLTRTVFDAEERRQLEPALRSFLNDAARLLDFEEQGAFRFWEPGELAALARSCGFEDVRSFDAFGEPPQAIVLAARRP